MRPEGLTRTNYFVVSEVKQNNIDGDESWTSDKSGRRDRPASQEKQWVIRSGRRSTIGELAAIGTRFRALFSLMRHSIDLAYQKAILGVLWLFIRPFVMVIAATFFFRDVLGVKTGEVPYPLFVLAGFAPWILFQRGLAWCTRGLNRQRRLIKQIRFPRIMSTISSVTPALVEFSTAFVCFVIGILYYLMRYGELYIDFDLQTLLFLPNLLLFVLLVYGISMFTGLLFLYARDVWYIMRYVITILMFATPVFYPLSSIPAELQNYFLINPLTTVFMAFRWSLFGVERPIWEIYALVVVFVICLNLAGLWFFHRWESRTFDEN